MSAIGRTENTLQSSISIISIHVTEDRYIPHNKFAAGEFNSLDLPMVGRGVALVWGWGVRHKLQLSPYWESCVVIGQRPGNKPGRSATHWKSLDTAAWQIR